GAQRRPRASRMTLTVRPRMVISLLSTWDTCIDPGIDRFLSGAAERQRSGAAGSGSEARASAGSRRLQRWRSAQELPSNAALHLYSLEQTLCHKLKNGRLHDARWRSLLPDNLLQAFHRFWGKEPFTRFPAHARRDMLNDEHLALLLKDIGDRLFLKG